MAKTQATLKLTLQGRMKIQRAINIAKGAGYRSLQVGTEAMVKPSVAEAAPNRAQEAALLSRTDEGRGTPEGGRFFKLGDQTYLQQAIKEEKVKMEHQAQKKQIWAGLGSQKELNPKIGFSWSTEVTDSAERGRPTGMAGRKGSTKEGHPAWGDLLGKWEYGGTFRGITGRAGQKLHIEPGIFRNKVAKTLPPQAMYSRGYSKKRKELRSYIDRDIKASVKKGV